MTGIPCRHAIACIFFQHKEVEDFVDTCYSKEVYLQAYAGSIPPCAGERHWPKIASRVDPLLIKIGPGRPRKNRRKDPYEDPKKPGTLRRFGMEMTCSICQVKGHNKRRCPKKDNASTMAPPPKKPRGRPRNDGQPPMPRQTPLISTPTGHNSQPITLNTSPAQLSPAIPSSAHHSITAQPSQLGRHGRMIRGGIGSRGGGTGTRGRGRGAPSSSRGSRG
ncbi:Ryanodine receptor 1 [Bienertia sinuspersici]